MNINSHSDKGEEMDLAEVHGPLLRELGEPYELYKRLPWYVLHGAIVLFVSLILYLSMQIYDWKEYEEDPVVRHERDRYRETLNEANEVNGANKAEEGSIENTP